MKNYLEHKDKVKYVDGLLAHSQEWQWFIDLLQESFETCEIQSWSDYENCNHTLRDVFGYFIKVLEVSDKDWAFSKPEFLDMWEIARYYIGTQTFEMCSSKMGTVYGKLKLFCIWITKLGNVSGDLNTKHIYDIRILTQKNYFQLIDLSPYLACEDALFAYIEGIDVEGLDEPINCLRDNLARIEHPYTDTFFDQNKDKFLRYDAFSYQMVSAQPYAPWQEAYLLDMLKVKFSEDKLQPLFSFNNGSVPDTSLWTDNVLHMMKDYFSNECADFIIDTILFVAHGEELPKKDKLTHLELLESAFETEEKSWSIVDSSSFKVVSKLFETRQFKDCTDEVAFRNLLKRLHGSEDAQFIIRLKENHYPINKQQNIRIQEYYQSKYKQINDANSTHELSEYLFDDDNSLLIDAEHLAIVQTKFNSCIKKDEGIIISSLFYRYMVFLINVNSRNQVADKRWVHSEMIRIQRLWEKEFFAPQVEKMHVHSYEHSLPTSEVIKFNERALSNPIYFALRCIPCSTQKITEIMQCTSEYPMVHMVTRMVLSPVFPNGGDKISFERHDIDDLLAKQVQELLETKGYKFLNILKVGDYVLDIHKRYREYTSMMASLFTREEELYSIVQAETDISLIPFSTEPTLGMLTQLFPVLELKIREFASLFGIFPFKKNLEDFMQYNDPSSLLREILSRIYGEQGGFENVPDLLFVYNMMYNSNSMNIRNECVHGRDYLKGASLKFALIVTLFALYMVIFRINTIKDNVSDLIELPE